ncbi:xanthine dehydrogenase family protein molybdopterin-binding subunit [Spirillospora sp. CA-128828]|uniref:xanthine dehydrogenase family protein molybdopterin-binding subunit n=1 Tax=Spirillospora sp. CA-128828 TaxID=3240033 RepID=UPI003D9228E6
MTGIIGGDVRRTANAALLAGTAQYVADLHREGAVHVRVVRSPVAHARITGIDVTEAAEYPGVVTVLTADDLPDVRIPIRLPMFETPEANRFLQPPLARGVVRYVGEPIAVVVATDPYVAEDAAELVDFDLDELDPVTGLTEALTAEPIHPEVGTNVVNTVPLRHGDVDAAFDAADIVVRERFRMHRHTAVPMETRGLLAEVDEVTGRLTLWGGAKVKHSVRQALAVMLGIEAERIRVAEVNVGGGFGVRGEAYPEDFLVAHLALRLRRPVKWVEDRTEHFVATNHAREQEHELEIAATSDGRLLAFRDRAWADHGGYVRSQGILPELLPAQQVAGPYQWKAFSVESTGVITNRTPVGTYRGPGMTEVTFARERLLDMLAARIGLDPAELRRRNLIPAAAMPFTFAMDEGSAVPAIVYESGDHPAALETLLDAAEYDRLRREVTERRAGGQCVGLGLAVYIEIGAIGPFEEARVVPDPAGGFTVHIGSGSLGQGIETVFAQIVADVLRVPVEDVRVAFSDTDEVPMGFGAFASRSTPVAGNAALLAARDLRAKAAEALGADADAVEFGRNSVHAAGVSLPTEKLGEGRGRFDKPHPTFSFGGALSVVAVDRPTGRVRVLRHIVMHDVGRAINPALVRGQLAGAASQGIGGALLEELLYDAQGQPLSTTFGDYRMPTASELPEIETVVVEHRPPQSNPLGAKGVGESGMVATPAAVANAVADALGAGVALTALPLTPGRVRAMLR